MQEIDRKSYEKWFNQKTRIQNDKCRPYFHEREIWWCAIGSNVGVEQDGKGECFIRPVLIFKKFNTNSFWAIPLSSIMRNDNFHTTIIGNDEIYYSGATSQLRTLDAKRLLKRITSISSAEHCKIQKAVINLCG